MEPSGTVLLNRSDVASLLDIDECMVAIEQAFKSYAEGRTVAPKVLGMHSKNGGFHIKTGLSEDENGYFVAKLNANFPRNSKLHGLPTIQGVIILFDAGNGRLLALADSIEITIIRTGAATGVAAKHLALPNAEVATICGCGNQGRISLKSLMKVRPLRKVYAFDIDDIQSESFSREFCEDLLITAIRKSELSASLRKSQILVTCTPSKEPFIHAEDIAPGTFIAAVGSDSEEKQELCTDLVALSKIVVDITEQSATIGEVHHAIQQKKISIEDIHAELGMIVAGKRPGRESGEEIIVFDSTGTALQDIAAASIVYEKAKEKQIGTRFNFSAPQKNDPISKSLKNLEAIAALNFWKPFR
jgi:alanine dehydrogenase